MVEHSLHYRKRKPVKVKQVKQVRTADYNRTDLHCPKEKTIMLQPETGTRSPEDHAVQPLTYDADPYSRLKRIIRSTYAPKVRTRENAHEG